MKVLRDNPGLNPSLDQVMTDAYQMATINAAQETGLDENSFPASCPWSLLEAANQDFYPE